MRSSSWDKSIFMLPGTTICSDCSFCLLSRLLQLLLEMTRRPEDFTSRLRQSHISFPRRRKLMGEKNTFYGSDLINGTVLQPTVEHKPLHNFFVLLSGLHPVDAWKCDSDLALNAHENFFNYSTYCWTAPSRKTDRVETNNDHQRTVVSVHSLEHMDVFLQLLIQRESDEEPGGKTSRFTQGSPHFGCKLNVSESWVGGSAENQHSVTSTDGRHVEHV